MREFFEKRAETWDIQNPPAQHAKAIGWGLGYLREGWGPLKGKTLVDLGCGTGVLLPHVLRELGEGKLWAVDFAQAMVEAAKAKYADMRLHFVCEDALLWPLPEGSLDGVLCYNSFPHFPKKKALSKVASWLKPEGFFLIWHGHGRKHINSIHREAGGAVARDSLIPAPTLVALARQAGFKEVAWVDEWQRWLVLLKKPQNPAE